MAYWLAYCGIDFYLLQAPKLISELRRLLPADCVLSDTEALRPYECDGLSAYRELPLAVVIPTDVDQICDITSYTAGDLRRRIGCIIQTKVCYRL